MVVTLVMVTSVDGKTTRWHKPDSTIWSSPEDQQFFSHLKSSYKLIVMGRRTYQEVKKRLVLTPAIRRIILTKNPKKFAKDEIPGQLEFTSDPPGELLTRLKKEGVTRVLLAGGSTLNKYFLEAKLIDDIYLTIEPRIFGSGKAMVKPMEVDVSLKLIESKTLNNQGTLMLHYNVIYDH
jgi:dihydrofolate reductase